MKKRNSSFIMISSVLMIVFFFYYFKAKYPDQNTILASINGEKISLWQLKQFARNIYGSFDENKKRNTLDILINQKILILYAEKTGIVKNILQPQFEKQEIYAKDRLMLEMFFEIHSRNTIKISNNDIKEYYDSQPLFRLMSINFPYSDPEAESKSIYASRELNNRQDFYEVYSIFNPHVRFVKPGLIGVTNFYKLPDYLQEHSASLIRQGMATKPIETEFGYAVFYRSSKPRFSEARMFIQQNLFIEKSLDLKNHLLSDISRNNRLNLFRVNNIFDRKKINLTKDVLITNSLTNDTLTEEELSIMLSDLYGINDITELLKQDIIDYIQLFISQKVILSLAHKNNYFNDRVFLREWNKQQILLQEKQAYEIVDYMMTRFYEENINIISDDELIKAFEANLHKYRRPDFFKLQIIVTNDRNSAVRAFNESLKNPDFNSIVVRYSNDPFANISFGVSPYLTKSDLEKSYEYLFNSNIGDILAPIEQEAGLFHVYKVLDRVPGAIKSFEEVKSIVTTEVLLNKMKSYINEIIKRHNIKVKIFID